MSKVTIVLFVIIAILLIAIVVLYFLGKRAEKKRAEQEEKMAASAQTVSMLIIDKKKMKLIDSGLPAAVIEQTPKMMRRAKMPIVKAKVGPKVMSFICDAGIFDSVPVKKEVKAVISGLYITSVKGLRGPITTEEPVKKGFRAKLMDKYKQANAELQAQKKAKKK